MEALQDIHAGLNNAYVLFSFFLGIYATVIAGRNILISGNFWGAMWVITGLAAAILVVTIILTVLGDTPKRGLTYYLYAIYFVISLPGLYATLQGSDNRRAALWYGVVNFFNAAAAYRAGALLVTPWE